MWTFPSTPTPISLTGMPTAAWNTRASGAPAGASGAIVAITSNGTMGITHTRAVGSPDNYIGTTSVAAASGGVQYRYTPLNSSAQFDLYSSMAPTTAYQAWLYGYTDTETHYFQNDPAPNNIVKVLPIPANSPTAFTSYDVVNTYGCPSNTVAVILEQLNGNQFYAIKWGSTDTASPAVGSWDIVVGVANNPAVPGSLMFQAKNATPVATNFLLKGYITAGIVWNTNLVPVTIPATVSGWNQLPASLFPTPGIGYFLRTPGVSAQANLATYPVRPAQVGVGPSNGMPVAGPDSQWYTTTAGTTTINVLGTIVTGATTPPTTAKGFLNIRSTAQP